jgi:hypothetical protein
LEGIVGRIASRLTIELDIWLHAVGGNLRLYLKYESEVWVELDLKHNFDGGHTKGDYEVIRWQRGR